MCPPQVQLHELGCDGYSKSYVFKGTKDITPKQLTERLGLGGGARSQAPAPNQPGNQPQYQNRFVTVQFLSWVPSKTFFKIPIVHVSVLGLLN